MALGLADGVPEGGADTRGIGHTTEAFEHASLEAGVVLFHQGAEGLEFKAGTLHEAADQFCGVLFEGRDLGCLVLGVEASRPEPIVAVEEVGVFPMGLVQSGDDGGCGGL